MSLSIQISKEARLPETLAADLPRAVGTRVRLRGWLHRRRDLAAVLFLVLRDRSGLAQLVIRDGTIRDSLGPYGEETVLEAVGTAVANAQAPGGVELLDPEIRPLSDPAETPPVPLWRPDVEAGLPTVLDTAPVTLRHPRLSIGPRLAAAAVRGFSETLTGLGCTEIFTPKIVGSSTESGAEVFGLDYFGQPAYLAQSPQFYKQTMVGVFERVFEVGPVFRAEPHDTVRHLAEYISLDAEFGFVRDHRDVMVLLREVLAGMLASVLAATRETAQGAAPDTTIGFAGPAVPWPASAPELPTVPETIPAVHFTEALRIAGEPDGEPDLSPAAERAVGDWAAREHGSAFVFVTGYPMSKRPFYTHPQTDPEPDSRWSNSFDLLFRGTELVTGGQRLHRHSDYLQALRHQGEPPERYAGYLSAFAHGMPPHGGFAIGLERFVASLLGVANVREVTTFPRDLHRLAP